MLIFVQKSNFKNKLIDNPFPVKGTPIKTNHEASNKKEYIWILWYAMVKAGDCPAFSPLCQNTTVQQKKEHTALENTELNRNRKYNIIFHTAQLI